MNEQYSRPFAVWLKRTRSYRGLSMNALAVSANTSQARITQLEKCDDRSATPSRDMVERLAAALTPEGASEEQAYSILRDGLYAAGYTAPLDKPPIINDRVEAIAAGASMLDDQQQVAILNLISTMKSDQWREGEEQDPPPLATRNG